MKKEIQIKNPSKTAAGFKAVKIAARYVSDRMDPVKSFKILKKLNQKKGIDCPGCAWPDPEKRSRLGEFCENGLKAIAEEAMSRKVDGSFFSNYSIEELRRKSDYWLGQQGRLVQPVIYSGQDRYYREISWEEAFERVGGVLRSLESPDQAVFYTSGRTSNEAAFLYQLFVRKFGTNNLPDCSNMCHESSGYALGTTLGIGKGSVLMEDFEHAELILIFGQNPGTNHPRMLNLLEKAKKKGTRIVIINPLKEIGLTKFNNPQLVKGWFGKGIDIADMYLQVKINQDVALLKAWMKILMEREERGERVLDRKFIKDKTVDFELLKRDLERYDLDSLIVQTGLSREDVEISAEWISKSDRIIACWAMGLTQHVNAVDNIREIVNILLMKGSIGKKGAGTCPVRGHSNVQGDRTMGIWERPTKEWTEKLREVFQFEVPESPGLNTVEAIEAMYRGDVKFFMALGGNLLPAAPDTRYTEKAFENCGMTVHVSTKLNRTHLFPGRESLILPCLGRTDKHVQKSGEQLVTVENSMGIVHASMGVLRPASQNLKSEPEIISSIAASTLPDDSIKWMELIDDYSKIRDLISRAIKGFEDYNKKIKNDNGFTLPNGAREGKFNTSRKAAIFTVNKLPDPLPAGHKYTLMTIRSHDQFNTTIYGLDDRYRGIFGGREVVFMNEEDMREESIEKEESIDIFNLYDEKREITGFKVVPYNIPRGCIAAYFPEANPLVPISLKAHGSHTPASKSVGVNISSSRT